MLTDATLFSITSELVLCYHIPNHLLTHLEPYFDLPFREAEGMCDLYPPLPGQVMIELELFL